MHGVPPVRVTRNVVGGVKFSAQCIAEDAREPVPTFHSVRKAGLKGMGKVQQSAHGSHML